MGNFALAAMPGWLHLWTLFWNEKSVYFLITVLLTKWKNYSGIIYSGVPPTWGVTQNSDRTPVLSRIFILVGVFFQGKSLETNT